jgi:ATP adenylyltransferase
MERLWSPWRLAYVTGTNHQDTCVFCGAHLRQEEELIVDRGRHAFVILNLYPYNSGHLMVVPYRHVATLAALTADELSEMMLLTQRSEIALSEVYQPQGINVGMNLGRPAGAGIADHIHLHLVPRWTGDTNFMSVVGNVRVLPEEVIQSAERLRPVFERLSREVARVEP